LDSLADTGIDALRGSIQDAGLLEELSDDDEAQITRLFVYATRQGWKTKLLGLFNQYAPEQVKSLQSTQQQVDGGLAVYEQRRNRLVDLANEAREIERNLSEQLAAEQNAAREAASTAMCATVGDEKTAAQEKQQLHEQEAEKLSQQLAVQKTESESLKEALSRVDATLERLRSQRDVLNARLQAAVARVKVDSAGEASHARQSGRIVRKLGVIAVGAAASLLVVVLLKFMRVSSEGGLPTGTSTTTTSSTTVEPTVLSAQFDPIDLLKKIDVERDAVHGNWKLDNGALVSPPSIAAARLQISQNLPDEYQLTVETERLAGQEYFVIGLVVDGRQCMLQVDWRDSKISGISNVDGMQANANETTREGQLLSFGKPSTIVINVRKDQIHVTCDGREIVDWQGDSSRLSLIDYWKIPDDQALFVASTRTVFRISKLELAPLQLSRLRSASLPSGAPRPGTWKINFLAGAQRPVTLTYLTKDRFLLKIGGVLSGVYRWHDDQLSIEEPEDKRYQKLVWKFDGDQLVLVDEPPDHPSGGRYLGTRMSFVTSSTSKEAQALVERRDSRVRSKELAITEVLTSKDWKWTEPKNLGPTIKSKGLDAAPWVSADGLTLLFISVRRGGHGTADFWMSQRASTSDDWGTPKILGLNVNSGAYDGSASMTDDGLTLVFDSFKKGGHGDSDIYISHRETKDSPWPKAANLGPTVNSKHGEWSSTVTPDGLEIYYSTVRPGGVGYVDMWKTKRETTWSPWQKPTNLGIWLNSPQADWDPTPTVDGLAILMGSNRPGSLGKTDIFLSVRPNKAASFGPPVSLGEPINTPFDESPGFLSQDGRTLWFASDRPGGIGNKDIWVTHRVPKQ
ncbi:MAG: hypothetical protein MI725_14640, partial [Pirellulales bacterium]|nr:hypothetical protein [Pirellulales bacterium]